MVLLGSLVVLVLTAILVSICAKIIYYRFLHPLAGVPGPFVASFSRLPLLSYALGGAEHEIHLALHRRYGPIVRVGPNHILLNDPAHGPWYYSLDKSTWWYSLRPDDHNLAFSTELNIKTHNAKKKRVTAAYSMSSLVANEDAMDRRISEFISRLDGFAEDGCKVDMGRWSAYLNLDVLLEMVFSEAPGFINAGADVKGILAATDMFLKMAQVLGIYPIFYHLLQLPFMKQFGPKPTDKEGAGVLFGMAERGVKDRAQSVGGVGTDGADGKTQQKDMLQSLTEYRDAAGQPTPLADVKNEALVAVFTGVDTTPAVLRAALLHISTNTVVHRKLVAEIDAAERAGNLSRPAQFSEVRQLVYLGAILDEALRLHPPMSTPFWRTAPQEGRVVEGHLIPSGTHIGINEWAISRNASVYGPDTDVFRPERFLDAVTGTHRRMGKKDLLFGYGDCLCAGRHFASMLMRKTLVEVFRDYEVVVAHPDRAWRSVGAVSIKHHDFFCVLHKRVREERALIA